MNCKLIRFILRSFGTNYYSVSKSNQHMARECIDTTSKRVQSDAKERIAMRFTFYIQEYLKVLHVWADRSFVRSLCGFSLSLSIITNNKFLFLKNWHCMLRSSKCSKIENSQTFYVSICHAQNLSTSKNAQKKKVLNLLAKLSMHVQGITTN